MTALEAAVAAHLDTRPRDAHRHLIDWAVGVDPDMTLGEARARLGDEVRRTLLATPPLDGTA